jgi:nucleoside-diphosphate-sugar epimerase
MRILITGGLGFVGINLVRHLASQNGTFVVAADLSDLDGMADEFLAPVRARLAVARLDVTDRQAYEDLVASEDITHIVHAAALTPTDEQERSAPARAVDVNLGGTLNALEAARRSPAVTRVLVASSSGVYDPAYRGGGRQPEAGPFALDNLYAITKYGGELLAARYAELCVKEMAAVRLGPVYGLLERPAPSRPRTSQPARLLAALGAGQAVRVAGPEVRRDWTFTADVAAAIWALLRAPRWRHPVYNVSCGRAVSFREVVDAFVLYGLQGTWVDDPDAADIAMRPHQERTPLDIARLAADTGFVPAYGLEEGVRQMVAEG